MILQTIKSSTGQLEYVLLPIFVYEKLRHDIDSIISAEEHEYIEFNPRDFIRNQLALKRMAAKVTQSELAKELKVSQAYISKIEQDDYKVTQTTFKKISKAIDKLKKKKK